MMRSATCLLAMAAAIVLAASARADVRAGVDAWQRGDYSAAVKEWRPLAEKGDADAQFNLAQAYKLGRGLPVDLTKAQTLYTAAAAQGHPQAQANLGLILFQAGRRAEAMPYLVKAAEAGDARAQYIYGTALFNGDNVAKDWPRAYAFMTRAAGAGMSQAVASLNQMDSYVPVAQRQQGVALAATMGGPAPGAAKVATADTRLGIPVLPPAPATAPPSPTAMSTLPPTRVAAAPGKAAKAVKKLAPAAPAATTGGKWRVQLGAYGSADAARRAWAVMRGKVSGLGGLSPDYISAGAVTRVQAGPLASKGAAAKVCAAASAAGQACFPVSR